MLIKYIALVLSSLVFIAVCGWIMWEMFFDLYNIIVKHKRRKG